MGDWIGLAVIGFIVLCAVFAVWPYFDAAAENNLLAGSFPSSAFSTLPVGESSARVDYFEPKPPRNYVMQWNLNIQQQLAQNLTALVAYVGSRGVHQPFRVDEADLVQCGGPVLLARPVGGGADVEDHADATAG